MVVGGDQRMKMEDELKKSVKNVNLIGESSNQHEFVA
jgi:hypothetical protein